MRHRFAALVLSTVALAAYAAPAQAVANPSPLPPGVESLITEGLTIEGPLINNLTLRKLM
ncbi:hypothetical protein ACIBBB_05030 [Streptomyces sp. NPDC051217]|uniref:hypothetical protein n=1 Tax=Streptomyces sp. NPDC051217 TaxID=3365644 RepID=UPI00378B5157